MIHIGHLMQQLEPPAQTLVAMHAAVGVSS
jgi:hypothetical protein